MIEQSRSQSVLFLAIGTEGYGQFRVWSGLLRGLTRRGYSITLVLLQSACAPAWKLDLPSGVEVISPPTTGEPAIVTDGPSKLFALARRVIGQVRIARWLRGELRARQVGLMIVQSPLEVGLAGVAARGGLARVFWMMPNGVSDEYPMDLNRRAYRLLFQSFQVIPIANSRYTDSTLGPGGFRRHVLHLGIDPVAFSFDRVQSLTRAELGISEEVPLLGLFSRLVEEKGHLVLVEALAQIDAEIHVLVCGGPTEGLFFSRLTERIAKLGLRDRVHFNGVQSEIAAYYGACDVILNTRLDPEPFGLSVIEAMSMRKPVLAHAAGGPSETVVDGTTGWLIDAPTPAAFTEGLRRMLADRQRWQEMGEAAEAHARRHFTEDQMLDGLIRIIEDQS